MIRRGGRDLRLVVALAAAVIVFGVGVTGGASASSQITSIALLTQTWSGVTFQGGTWIGLPPITDFDYLCDSAPGTPTSSVDLGNIPQPAEGQISAVYALRVLSTGSEAEPVLGLQPPFLGVESGGRGTGGATPSWCGIAFFAVGRGLVQGGAFNLGETTGSVSATINIQDDGTGPPPVILQSIPVRAFIAPTNPACRGVYLVGARGLGEKNNDFNGFGQTIAVAVSAFRNHYSGGPVSTHFLDYKTNSLGGLIRSTLKLKNGVLKFLDGANEGINKLEQMLITNQLACPDQSIVLLGYSEGALVVDQTLVQLQSVGSSIPQHVIGVGLIADPHRLGTAPYTFGTAHSNLNGLSRTFALYPAADLPASVQNDTVSYCSDGDMVCAWDTGLLLEGAVGVARAIRNTDRVHTTYWQSASEIVGDMVADRAMSP